MTCAKSILERTRAKTIKYKSVVLVLWDAAPAMDEQNIAAVISYINMFVCHINVKETK